jgi:hypothetical protein
MRVVLLPAAVDPHVGGDELAFMEDLHQVPGLAGVHAFADQPPRHAVERLAHSDMDIRADLG